MLISINIDTELYSPRAITDLRETESLLRRMWPELAKDTAPRPCPIIVELDAPVSEVTVGVPLTTEDGQLVAGTPEVEAPAAGTEAPTKRRGRPRKEAPAESAAGENVETVNPPDVVEFSALLETLRSQMQTAEKTVEQIDAAVKEWVGKGPEALADLRATIDKNQKFLDEVAAAKAKAQETRDGKAGEATEQKAPGLDKLRDALTTYVNGHKDGNVGMKAGLQLLKDFGCARVSELENKPVADQLEFIKLATAPVPNA